MPSSHEIQTRFEDGIDVLKPYLFHLADQVVDAYEQKQWNLLIGDDTSGRLVTRFVRLALAQTGVIIPTRYIAASKTVHHLKPFQIFSTYAQQITNPPTENTQGLIVTESISRKATSLSFIYDLLARYCQTLDTAILGARQQPLEQLGKRGAVYCGGIENKALQTGVWQALENPTAEKNIDDAWSGPLTNLVVNMDTSSAVARRLPDTTYRSLASLAYRRMNDLAVEWASKNSADSRHNL
jgi:hypothetical protein